MKSGLKTIKRQHARNYTHESAQKRLDETVPAYNAQVLNALNVDYVQIQYYPLLKLGKNCTCEKHDTNTIADSSDAFSSVRIENSTTDNDYEIVGIEEYGSLFGDTSQNSDFDDDEDLHPVVNENMSVDSIFAGSNVNCGLCYRSGFLPGYSMLNGMRVVLTHYDICDANGYNIQYDSPYTINKLHIEGYVEFELHIPKYYEHVQYSIRNNHNILNGQILVDQYPISLAILQANAGKKIRIRCFENQFTHVVFEFHQTNLIRANIPNVSKTLDYTMLETMGNLQVVLPMTIGNVSAGDHIAIPKRNLFLKVVDVDYSNTATLRKLEWKATCRVLQPQEALRKLSVNKKIF